MAIEFRMLDKKAALIFRVENGNKYAAACLFEAGGEMLFDGISIPDLETILNKMKELQYENSDTGR